MCETKLIWAMGPLLYAPKVAYVCSHHEACLQEVVCCASDVSFNVKNTWPLHQPSKKRCGVPTSFRCNSHLESSQPGPQRLNPSIPITPLPGRCIICTWQCPKDAWLGTKRKWQRSCPRCWVPELGCKLEVEDAKSAVCAALVGVKTTTFFSGVWNVQISTKRASFSRYTCLCYNGSSILS